MRLATLLTCLLLLGACGEPETRSRGDGPEGVGAASAPDELVLTCTADDGQQVDGEVVRPQSDGVHLAVDNQRDYDPGISFRLPGGGGGGRNAPPGQSTFVLDTGPGVLEVACYPKDQNEEPQYMSATVVDPEGLYTREELECVGGAVSGGAGYAEIPEGKPDATAVAREQLEFGLEEGDELRRAGYPDSREPVFVVVRDDRVVAATPLARGQSGWFADGYSACDDFAN